MTLTSEQIATLMQAPFILSPMPDVPHELCRKGLLAWHEGAWRLTAAGELALAEIQCVRAA